MPRPKTNKTPRERAGRVCAALRDMRVDAELSLADVGKRMDLSGARVGQIDTGNSGLPTMGVIVRFAQACGYRTILMFVPEELAGPVAKAQGAEPSVCVVPRGDR